MVSNKADAERAYLYAFNIDRNQVAIAAKDMAGLPRESLVNKGLYGTKKGALGWEKWCDVILVDEMKYMKLDVAKGVYLKILPSGKSLTVLRHSDDFKFSSIDKEGMELEQLLLKEKIRMTPFTAAEEFLGTLFQRYDVDGVRSERGTILLVSQAAKITEMSEKFSHLTAKYNKHGRIRTIAVPVNAIREDSECIDTQAQLLSVKEHSDFQSLGGGIGWVTGTRPDAKFGYFLIARKLSAPREWDMHVLVWLLNYLTHTAKAPLVLGGPIVDPELHSDASMATLTDFIVSCK